MSEITNRAAVIIYTLNPHDTNDLLILVGISRYGITTIGGSKKENEQEIHCCIRECYEETRHIINFEQGRALLKQAKTFKYEKCIYYLVPGCYEDMMAYCKEFLETKIDDNPDSETNEMLEIRMVSANSLIKDFVMGKFTDASGKYAYMSSFVSMFMDMGYDKLRNNTHNHYVNSINMPVKLNVPLADLPAIVSVSLLKHGLPVLYGYLQDNKNCYDDSDERQCFSKETEAESTASPVLHMSSQLYYETAESKEVVFRNYIIVNGVATHY